MNQWRQEPPPLRNNPASQAPPRDSGYVGRGPAPGDHRGPGDEKKKRKLPLWLTILLVIGGVLLATCAGTLIWYGETAPDTWVYEANAIPQRFIDTAVEEGLIDEGERVDFLYSDALLDVSESIYILTERRLVVHNQAWAESTYSVPFDQITSVDATWSDTWLDDSWIYVETSDDKRITFPLSSEHDRDHRFVETLKQRAGLDE